MSEPAAGAASLIRCLADGEFHSGRELGAELGISRAAVWKRLRRLDEFGLELEAVRGTGYRLARALDLLDAARVRASFRAATRCGADIELVASTGSTSSDLLARAGEAREGPRALVAEHQYGGRGRRGRGWITPYGAGIAFSLLRRFELAPAELGGLSLAIGVALVEALDASGIGALGLKWPNDIVHAGDGTGLRKLGGVLLEVRAEAQGPSAAVIGVGLNYALGGSARRIDQPNCDLASLVPLAPGMRSDLVGRLLAAAVETCDGFARQGAGAWLRRWPRYDVLRGAEVVVERGGERLHGRALGINAQGALRLRDGARTLELHAGDVSLRRADA